MNPEVVREVTRRVQRIPELSPQDRRIIAAHAAKADSWDEVPEWLRSLLDRRS